MAKFCDVHSAIARFYITEVDAHRKRTSGAFIHPKWEENLFKEQARTACTILSFTISACLGEARHAFRPYPGGRIADGDEDDYRWRAVYEIVYRALKQDPNTGLSGHKYRAMLFKVSIPMHLWIKTFEALAYLYGNLNWREGGFGGEKWAAICKAAIACYKASFGDDLTTLTLRADRLVNLCHNGGIFLDKFECGYLGACARHAEIQSGSAIVAEVECADIGSVLKWHSIGPENILRAIAENPLCRKGPREGCPEDTRIHTKELEEPDEIEKILEGKKIKAKDPTYSELTEELAGSGSGSDDEDEPEGLGDGPA